MPADSPFPTTCLESTDSTNLLARRAIESGELDGTPGHFYIAARQTGGIGRQGRAWHSPAGGLWCSLAHPVADGESPSAPEIANALGLRVGVACLTVIAEALTRSMSPVMPMLKWPNDVLIKRRKVCGTLCEALVTPASANAPRTSWFIIGVGINVNNDVRELPDDLRRAPIALRDLSDRDFDLTELASSLLRALLTAASTPGPDARTLSIARERLYGKGASINVVAPGGLHMPGMLVNLSDDGVPIIRTGEIEFVIPPGSELV